MAQRGTLARWTLGPAALLAAAGVGCVQQATEVIVVVDTDVPADRAMELVALVAAGASSTPSRHTWTRAPGVAGAIALPASFGVIPPAADPSVTGVTLSLRVHVAAGAHGEPAIDFERVAGFAFAPHQTTVLRLFLAADCGAHASGCAGVPPSACTLSLRCAELGQTCGDQARCTTREVTPLPLTQDDGSAGAPRPDIVRTDAVSAVDVPITPDVLPARDAPTDACPAGASCLPGATRTVSCGPCATQTDTCSASCAWTAGSCSGSCCTPHAGCAGGNPIGAVCSGSGDDGCGGRCTCDSANGESCNTPTGFGTCCHNSGWFCANQGECCPGLTCLGNICM